jgi:hypothetical protein
VDKHEAELKKHNKLYEFHMYAMVRVTASNTMTAPPYCIEQALDSWNKEGAYFETHLSKWSGAAGVHVDRRNRPGRWRGCKGEKSGFPLTHAVGSYDNPHHALFEDAIVVEFVNRAYGPRARVAVEISPDAA